MKRIFGITLVLTIMFFSSFIVVSANKLENNAPIVSKGVEYRAVIMGISDYPGSANDLATPVQDVNAIETVLKKSSNSYDIKKLLNDEVTISNVRSKLDWLKNNADNDDISFFYYCGHGTQIDSNDYAREGDVVDECFFFYDNIMRDDEFTDTIAEIKGKVVVILDSCKCAGFIQDLQYIHPTNEIAMFTAHAENQNLFEIPIMQRGLLTFHIIGGLTTDKNNDYKITAEECYNTAGPIYEDGKDVYHITYQLGINVYYSKTTAKNIPILTGFTNNAPEKTKLVSKKINNNKFQIKTTINDDADNLELFVYWGDGTGGWNGPYNNKQEIMLIHEWSKSGEYEISVIARDKHGSISDWETITITVTKNRSRNLLININQLITNFLEKIFNKQTIQNNVINPL